MGGARSILRCEACGHAPARWAGRCPSCGAWGSILEVDAAASARPAEVLPLADGTPSEERRIPTGLSGLDVVLGGGIVPGSVVLLAGEPGIGKSTLLLQVLAGIAGQDLPVLLASGEESREQVAARAGRLGVAGDAVAFAPGRDLPAVLEAARRSAPAVLAIDSIQAIRDPAATQAAGGVAQVRACADRLVGLAKELDVAVLMTGHVTKDGEVAGPRALEHAVDVVLGFDGDPRSGLRIVTAGKNRFGADGEACWFEMRPAGLVPVDPTSLLRSADAEPGAATALVRAGRRALAVEVQALVAPSEGPARRQATGLDPRRFQLVAAVLDRATGLRLGRAELYGAVSGGLRLDDPGADLAIAAALTSAATGVPPPADAAFVGELTLTGAIRPSVGMPGRLGAARAAGLRVFGPIGSDGEPHGGHPVRHLREALTWAFEPPERAGFPRSA